MIGDIFGLGDRTESIPFLMLRIIQKCILNAFKMFVYIYFKMCLICSNEALFI